MKIERVNDTQIRCTLSSFDLSARNLNVGELAYGSDNARSLFREMMQKASVDVGFDTEDMPLMVEAIPLSDESVVLVITKVEDPEEVDTRFAKFSPMYEENMSDISMAGLMPDTLEGSEELLSESTKSDMISTNHVRIYAFDSIDQATDAAIAVGSQYTGPNTLYKNPAEKKYYLLLDDSSEDMVSFASTCNILAEYGTRIMQNYSSKSYFDEHYEVLIKDHALVSLASIG